MFDLLIVDLFAETPSMWSYRATAEALGCHLLRQRRLGLEPVQ